MKVFLDANILFSSSNPQSATRFLLDIILSKCTHLWTGDKKHFPQLYGKTIHGVKIVSSIMLAEEIL